MTLLGSAGSAPGRPRVAVLVPHWEARSEEGWITRQVAGAIATTAEVHVITPTGRTEVTRDGVFHLHHLPEALDRVAEVRRDLLIDALSGSGLEADADVPPELGLLLDRDLLTPWQRAAPVLRELAPDVIVIAGHDNLGAVAAVDSFDPSARVAILALGTTTSVVGFPHYREVLARAQSILVITERERGAIAELNGNAAVHRIGAPLAANPSAFREPNMAVGRADNLLVITTTDSDDDEHEEAEIARLLRIRLPRIALGIAHNDAFCVWSNGTCNAGWPIGRSSDLQRLMAWARATIDLAPGRLLGRRCIESLLYGTPVVVGSGTAAQEHAERGKGGLWFDDATEAIGCAEAMLDSSVRNRLGSQGRAYAEEEYGSTSSFIDRVLTSCELPGATASVSR